MNTSIQLQQKFASVWALMDERTRRLMAANEALTLGYGGVSQVSRACGLSRKAIAQGVQENLVYVADEKLGLVILRLAPLGRKGK